MEQNDWFFGCCEMCYDNYQETVYFFLAAILGCIQTGVKASLISDYATLWLLMR